VQCPVKRTGFGRADGEFDGSLHFMHDNEINDVDDEIIAGPSIDRTEQLETTLPRHCDGVTPGAGGDGRRRVRPPT
jgi:hypothetical protein